MSQFYYIALSFLPLHLSLSISVNAKLNNFSTTQDFSSKTQAQNSRILPKLNFSEIPFPNIAAQTAKKSLTYSNEGVILKSGILQKQRHIWLAKLQPDVNPCTPW